MCVRKYAGLTVSRNGKALAHKRKASPGVPELRKHVLGEHAHARSHVGVPRITCEYSRPDGAGVRKDTNLIALKRSQRE